MVIRSAVATMTRQLEIEGFSVARGLVARSRLEALQLETRALIEAFASGHRSSDFWWYPDASTERAVLYRVHNLEKQPAPACSALFESGVLHDLAGELLGDVEATVCAMIVKTPGVA